MKLKGIVLSALFCLLLKGHKASSAECSEPWIDLGYLGCFYFASESKPMNWFDAQMYCNDLDENAFLAEILDEETQLVIKALTNELPSAYWWLGGSDFFQEGEWRWMKSGKLLEYTDWAPGQPDNSDELNHTEDCLHLYHHGFWNDEHCRDEASLPLCQLF